jgi:hypothetical protein
MGVLVIVLLVSSATAAYTVMKPNTTYEAMLSSILRVKDTIILNETGNGFVVMTSNWTGVGVSPENPVYFNSTWISGFAHMAINESDWVYDIRLTTTELTPPNSVFKVEFRGHGGSYVANLYVATDDTVEPGEQAACLFRIGPNLPPLYSYRVTVQKMP